MSTSSIRVATYSSRDSIGALNSSPLTCAYLTRHLRQPCSIHATVLRNRVVRAVGPEIPNAARLIPIEIVFEHPTVEKLAQAIFSIVTAGTSSAEDQASCSAPEQAIEAAIERFSDGIRRNPNTHPSSLSSFAVLVTGSTGQLGSHLLASLLSDPRVTRIYALNRSSPTVGSQINRFKAHGLNPSRSYYDKLVFLDGALDKKLLGLHQSTYDEVCSSIFLDSAPHVLTPFLSSFPT